MLRENEDVWRTRSLPQLLLLFLSLSLLVIPVLLLRVLRARDLPAVLFNDDGENYSQTHQTRTIMEKETLRAMPETITIDSLLIDLRAVVLS